MKTVILYASKNGGTRVIAQRMASKMEGAHLYDLKQGDIPDIRPYDCVIVGSPVYAGMIRKEAKAFMEKNAGLLCEKRLGLFVCGLDESKEKAYFDSNFPAEVLRAAVDHAFLGGVFDPRKAGMMGRMIMKAVAKQSGYRENNQNDRLGQFVEAMTI